MKIKHDYRKYLFLRVSTEGVGGGGSISFRIDGFGLKNTEDRGSAVIFDANSGLFLSYVRILGPKGNLDRRSFFSLGRNVNEFIQILSFFKSSFKLRCVYCVIIKHDASLQFGRNEGKFI